MILRLLTRVVLVSLALWYISPHVTGVKFHGDIWGLIVASLIFNAAFWGLECLLAVVVFGINIGTLGLGAFITGSLKFAAALLSPSIALVGTAQLVPNFLQVNSLFPGALVFGLMLGGLLWASIPDKQKSG